MEFPVQLFITSKTKNDLQGGQFVIQFNNNVYYACDIINRQDEYSIRKLKIIDFDQYSDVLQRIDY